MHTARAAAEAGRRRAIRAPRTPAAPSARQAAAGTEDDAALCGRRDSNQLQGRSLAAGIIYVAEANSNLVQKLSPTGQLLLEVGGRGSVPGRLNGPTEIAVDKVGNFYVMENVNSRVQKFSPGGRALRTFGTGAMEFPSDVALDGSGDIYVCEPAQQRIDELSPSGRKLKVKPTPAVSSDALWG